ncbi:diguanylate cyclase [Alteromonas portus]|uniref:GGDEF domain-containing protein n=1 Tax=Alteromonas portus TaxID=2565549 RepID=UPI003BF84AE2
MTWRVSLNFVRLFIGLFLCAASAHSLAKCYLEDSADPHSSTMMLQSGDQRLRLICNIDAQHILYFPRNYINYNQLYDSEMRKVQRLPSAFEAYAIDSSNDRLYLDINAQVERSVTLKVTPLSDFQKYVSVHTLTMSLFIGFCLALTLYVGMLGNSMQNYGFYSYSFYVFSAGVFFLLQEGLLNIAFPQVALLANFQLHLLFAGVTVFAGVKFLDQLLDFKALLKGWQRQFMLGMACAALAFSVVQLILPVSDAMKINSMLSLITLITMTCTLSACVYAAYRKVHCANLVMLGIAVMVFTMLFRLVFVDVSAFMYRYALIVGITIEAFIFAIATSRKVKKLDDDRLSAFKRASTDSLCKVLNRSGWEGVAQSLLNNFNKEGGYLTLLFIDIDKFKEINDQYGHHAGDKVLQVIAKILMSRCREQDAVGRLGGDEFVVLSHCYSEGQAERLAARIEESLAERDIRTENVVINATASVGAYITKERCKDLSSLLTKADELMYSVKEKHKSAQCTANP